MIFCKSENDHQNCFIILKEPLSLSFNKLLVQYQENTHT